MSTTSDSQGCIAICVFAAVVLYIVQLVHGHEEDDE